MAFVLPVCGFGIFRYPCSRINFKRHGFRQEDKVLQGHGTKITIGGSIVPRGNSKHDTEVFACLKKSIRPLMCPNRSVLHLGASWSLRPPLEQQTHFKKTASCAITINKIFVGFPMVYCTPRVGATHLEGWTKHAEAILTKDPSAGRVGPRRRACDHSPTKSCWG